MACTKDVGCSWYLLTIHHSVVMTDPELRRELATFEAVACARSSSRSSLSVHVSTKSRCLSTRGVPAESSIGWLVLSVWFIKLYVASRWLNGSKTSRRKLGTSAKVLSQPDNCRRLTRTLAEGSLKVTCPQDLGSQNTWLLISQCACDLFLTVVCLTRDVDTARSIELRRLAAGQNCTIVLYHMCHGWLGCWCGCSEGFSRLKFGFLFQSVTFIFQ